MNGAQYALAALVGEPVEDARHKARRQAGIAFAIGLIGAVPTLWLLVAVFLYSWRTDDWQRLQAAEFLPLPFLYLLAFAPLLPGITAPSRRLAIQPLRALLASGGEEFAPPAPVQPAPLTTDELTSGPRTFARLRSVLTWWDVRAGTPFWPAMLLLFGQYGIQLPNALGFERQFNRLFGFDSPLSFVPLLLALAPILVYFVILMTLAFRTISPRLVITAYEEGLAWRAQARRPRERRAPWSAVRAFARTTYSPPSGMVSGGTDYLLDLGDATLSWTLTAGSKDDEYLESEALSRLIVTRTGQPLRDLSSWMTRIQAARGDVARLRDAGLPPDALAEYSALRRRWRQRLWLLLPAVVTVFAITFDALFAPGSLESRRFAYLDTLPALVHAETPLYRSSLAADDDNWPVSSRTTAGAGANRAFTNGAYQLTGVRGVPVVAVMPRVYGDAAVEVTGLTTNVLDASGLDTDSVGLVVRANADLTDMIIIAINQVSGEWRMEHIRSDPQGKVIQDDRLEDRSRFTDNSLAVRIGGPNTLLVLMRGDAFTFYLNGSAVGTGTIPRFGEQDPLPIPAAGRIGVYLEDGANTGVFTNFAVYPLTSPPALNYV